MTSSGFDRTSKGQGASSGAVLAGAPVIALHGFLGLASDWSQLGPATGSWKKRDLWADMRALIRAESDVASQHADRSPHPAEKNSLFDAWAEMFCFEVGKSAPPAAPRVGLTEGVTTGSFLAPEAASQSKSLKRPWLVAYSMGARLAMHALVLKPELFAGAVLVSGHTGLSSVQEREARLVSDAKWAERFRSETWSDLMAAWNSQPVLRTSMRPNSASDSAATVTSAAAATGLEARRESDFDRESLARAMTGWSLGHQDDLWPRLREIRTPLVFVAGANDTKFRDLLNAKTHGSNARFEIIEGAGHRVPWDQPASFLSILGL